MQPLSQEGNGNVAQLQLGGEMWPATKLSLSCLCIFGVIKARSSAPSEGGGEGMKWSSWMNGLERNGQTTLKARLRLAVMNLEGKPPA